MRQSLLEKFTDTSTGMAGQTLHRYFVQRHAWFVRGLSSLSEETPRPDEHLEDKVEEFAQGAFEQRMGSQGPDLKDMSAVVAP